MKPWPKKRLQDLGTWAGGGTPSKQRPEFWKDGDVPWLSPKDMGPQVLSGTKDHITEAAVKDSATRLIPANSVAVVVRSGILERTVPIALVPFATTLNQDMKALVPNAEVDPRWVAWGLRANESGILRTCRKAGTTVASLEFARLASFELPLPPIQEQRTILSELEDHLSRLDAGFSLLNSAGLRSSSLGTRLLGSLAEGHATSRKLGELAVGSGYGTSTKCMVGGPGVAVVRIPNLRGGRIDLTEEKRVSDPALDLRQLMLQQDDLLIVRTNGSRDLIGRSAVVQSGINASFASYLIRFQLDLSLVRPQWVRAMLDAPQNRRILEGMAASSAGQYNLSLSKLNAVPIPCPSLEEQDRLLALQEERTWPLDTLTEQLQGARARARSLRQALLTAAFSGDLSTDSTRGKMTQEDMSDA